MTWPLLSVAQLALHSDGRRYGDRVQHGQRTVRTVLSQSLNRSSPCHPTAIRPTLTLALIRCRIVSLHRSIHSSAARWAGSSSPRVLILAYRPLHICQTADVWRLAHRSISVLSCVLLALYELSLFDAADAVALDHEYTVQQYQALLATVAAQRTASKRPVSGGVKQAEEQKTNDEQQLQQESAAETTVPSVTNVCTYDLKQCGPPRSS